MPGTEPLKVAVLGTGRIAGLFGDATDGAPSTHAGAIARDPRFLLSGAFDLDAQRARDFCNRWKAVPFSQPGDLLDGARPDVVVVATPDDTHANLVETILGSPRRPRLLIVEKPLCVTRLQLKQLVAHAGRSPETKVVVNLVRRFDARHRAIAAAIQSQFLGDVIDATFTYYGGWLHNGAHAVDTLRMLLGGELRVRASATTLGGSADDPCRSVDATSTRWKDARIRFRAFDQRFFQLFELELRCVEGRLRLEDFGQRVVTERVAVNPAGERELTIASEFSESVPLNAWQTLYDASARFLLNGDSAALDGAALDSAAQTMEVLFDAID